MNNEEQLMQTLAQMKGAGMSDGMIKNFMQRINAAAEQEAQAQAFSQSDKIMVTKAEGDVPGVYIDSRQVAQDLFANAVAKGQDVTPRQQSFGGPPRATDLSVGVMAAGNPNYVVAKPTRTTINDQGHIVTY